MADTIFVRGEGGSVFEMDLPLPEGIAQRMEKGLIKRVQADGSDWLVPAAVPVEPEVPAPPTVRPAASASKAAWVGWAVVQGIDPEEAEAMTKADLVELLGGE